MAPQDWVGNQPFLVFFHLQITMPPHQKAYPSDELKAIFRLFEPMQELTGKAPLPQKVLDILTPSYIWGARKKNFLSVPKSVHVLYI